MQSRIDPEPRTGAAYIGLGEVCLTPGLVMHYASFACSLSDWLLSLSLCTSQSLIIIPHLHVSHLIGYTLKASLSCPGQAVSLQKTLLHMYTLVVCPILCVVASSSQCHSATAHVASHTPPGLEPVQVPSVLPCFCEFFYASVLLCLEDTVSLV